MIRQGEELILKDGTRDTRAFITLSSDICKAIKRFDQYDEKIKEARRWGWPISPVWHELPARIVAMKNKILELVHDPSARARDVVHQRFLDDLDAVGLGRDYQKLGRMRNAPVLVYRNARPG